MDLLAIAGTLVTVVAEPSLHAADKFLSVPVALLFWAITIVVVGISVRRVGQTLDDRAIPLMGVMGAFNVIWFALRTRGHVRALA